MLRDDVKDVLAMNGVMYVMHVVSYELAASSVPSVVSPSPSPSPVSLFLFRLLQLQPPLMLLCHLCHHMLSRSLTLLCRAWWVLGRSWCRWAQTRPPRIQSVGMTASVLLFTSSRVRVLSVGHGSAMKDMVRMLGVEIAVLHA